MTVVYLRFTQLSAVLSAALLLLIAGASATLAAPVQQAGGEVTGIVFADSNENGLYDEGELGIEGVSVSNGLGRCSRLTPTVVTRCRLSRTRSTSSPSRPAT